MPNALLESYCYINFRITQIKPLSFLLFKQMSVSALLKRKCPTQLLLFCQDFFFSHNLQILESMIWHGLRSGLHFQF